MRRVYIFVEGPTDGDLLRRFLPEEVLKGAEFVVAGGSSGVLSLARSILARRKKPVAVVMDSDSLEPDVIEERQQSTEELIRAAGAAVPVKVVSAVPEIEAWFFAAPEVIARVLGRKVPAELVPLGKRDPAGVLQQLEKQSKKKWDPRQAIGSLDGHDIQRIRALPEVAELSTFLKQVQQGDEAA